MSFPQPRPRLDALGAQLRALQMVKHLPAPSGSVSVSAVRKGAGQATQFVVEAEGTPYGKENNEMPKKYGIQNSFLSNIIDIGKYSFEITVKPKEAK